MATITQTHLSRIFLLFLSVQFQPFMVQPRSLKPHSGQALDFLRNQKGEITTEVHAVAQNYLKAFGYLDNEDSNLLEGLQTAIKKFQKYYNLNVSGKLDSETVKEMSMPRCGVPDNPSNSPLNNSKYTFFSGNPKWPPSKTHLTYSFKSGVEVVSMEIMRYVFQQAFGQWSQVTSFTFAEAANGTSSDLVLGFFRGDHGDGSPFDGPWNVLAHAFAPVDGRLHFDADEKWSTNIPPQGDEHDLIWVAIHEVGHLLGLQHSNDQNAVMYAIVAPGVNKRTLGADDIAGIKALYS